MKIFYYGNSLWPLKQSNKKNWKLSNEKRACENVYLRLPFSPLPWNKSRNIFWCFWILQKAVRIQKILKFIKEMGIWSFELNPSTRCLRKFKKKKISGFCLLMGLENSIQNDQPSENCERVLQFRSRLTHLACLLQHSHAAFVQRNFHVCPLKTFITFPTWQIISFWLNLRLTCSWFFVSTKILLIKFPNTAEEKKMKIYSRKKRTVF